MEEELSAIRVAPGKATSGIMGGGNGAGEEEDVTEATTRDKTVKAEVTEVKEEKAAVR